jgi:Flp pilus assembly protein TadD
MEKPASNGASPLRSTNATAANHGVNIPEFVYALDKQDQLDQAIEQYRKSVELDDTNASAYASLSIALARAGNLPESIAAAKQALALNPTDVLTEGNLATSLLENWTDR